MDLKEKVITEIKKIYDPEIPVNIYELGLIYDIKIKDKDTYSLAEKHDFSEICITSSASVSNDSNLEKEIEITSSKAVGNKCPVCWKIRENICERDGNCHLS